MKNNKKTAAIVSLYGNSNFGNKLQNYAVQEILKKEGLNTVNIVNIPCLNNKKVNHIEVLKLYIKGWFRYILKGGFLDGKEGFIWHILQCFWYRMLVDAKVYELKKQCGWNEEKIKTY